MANNFQQWQEDWEGKLPDDIEQKVLHHANTLSQFGRVMELFVPNALQTAAHLIGGASRKAPGPRRPANTRYSDPVLPEGRPPSGGSDDERLLSFDTNK